MLIKSLSLAFGWIYLHDLSHMFLKRFKLLWGKIARQKRLGQTSRLSIFYRFSNHKNFIPKYLDKALTDFA